MMEPILDIMDRNIISILQKDGRTSSAEIARVLGESERTVRHRVERLIQLDAIYPTVVVNHKFFGYPISVDIFCEVQIEKIEEIGNQLKEFPEINYIAYSFGDQDISIQALFQKADDAFEFIQKLAHTPGIARSKTVFVPRIVKNTYEWLPPETDFSENKE